MPDQTPAQQVAAEVSSHLARRGVKKLDAARRLNMTPDAFGRRLRGTVDFRVSELADLALMLGVHPSAFWSATHQEAVAHGLTAERYPGVTR